MTPTYEQFLSGSCRWDGEHQGIHYQMNWHGRSDYMPEGTWCWYILVNSEQFYEQDWDKLRLRRDDREMFGSWRRRWDYDKFPDLDAHGGWTFGEMSVYLGRDGLEHEMVKVGCDYAHLWDRESGYREGKDAIERDVKHSIDLLVEMFPNRRLRCKYCGRYGEPDEFYRSTGFDEPIHKFHEEKLRADGWEKWLPQEVAP